MALRAGVYSFLMASKYKQYYQDMIKQNSQLFEQFKIVHDNFVDDPDKYKKEFNDVGEKVMEIVRSFEQRLTSQMTGSGFGKFATNVTDKFKAEIKKDYPKIDFVGVK
jgi:gamma-glutamylcysteine synthetase